MSNIRFAAASLGLAGLMAAAVTGLGTGTAWATQPFGEVGTPMSVEGQTPCAAAFDSSTGAVYAAFQSGGGYSACQITTGGSGGSLAQISGDTIANGPSLGDAPTSLAVDSDTGRVYVAEYSGSAGQVQVFDGLTPVTTVGLPGGDEPYGVAVDPFSDVIYVATYDPSAGTSSVQLIGGATDTIARTIPLPAGYAPANPAIDPGGIGVDPSTHAVFVANGKGGVDMISESGYAVTPISTSGDDVFEIAVDPATETVYASGTNLGSGVLSVIPESTDTDLENVSLPLIPYGMSVNSVTEAVYVAGGSGLDVLSGATPGSGSVQQLGSYDGGGAGNDVAADSATAAAYLVQTGSPDGTIVQIATVPDAPQNVMVTTGQTSATVKFSPPLSTGGAPVRTYTVTATDLTHPAQQSQTAVAAPVTLGGLSTGDRYTFTVTAANQVGSGPASAPSAPVTIGGVTIITTSLPEGVLGSPYSATLSATGGATPYTWSATGLPAGLSVNAATGTIVGTPASRGTYSVTVTVRTADNLTASQTLSLTVIFVKP